MENRTDRQTLHMLLSMLNRVVLLSILLTLAILLVGCPPKSNDQAPKSGSVDLILKVPAAWWAPDIGEMSGGCPAHVAPNIVDELEYGTIYFDIGVGWTGPVSGATRVDPIDNTLFIDGIGLTGSCDGNGLHIHGLPVGTYVFTLSYRVYRKPPCNVGDPCSQPGANPPIPTTYSGSATVTVLADKTVTATIVTGDYQGLTGSMEFRWTVTSKPTPTACPPGSLVSFESTTQPGIAPFLASRACTGGFVQLTDVAVGQYYFNAMLSGGTITTPVVQKGVPVTVNPVATTPVILDFPDVGTLNLAWLVDGQPPLMGCPTGANIAIYTVPAGASPIAGPVPCTSSPLKVPLLPTGTNTLAVKLTVPSLGFDHTNLFTTNIQSYQTTSMTFDLHTKGSVIFAWTVNGMSPATACPVGATVSAESTTQPGDSPVSAGPVPCANSPLEIQLPAPGDYSFTATLTSGNTNTAITGLSVTRIIGSFTYFNLDFVLPILPILPAPTNPFAQPADNAVFLAWNAVTGAASYNIYWATTAGVTPTNGTKINTTSIPYMHNALNPTFTYYYVITALDAGGVEGPPSLEVSAKPIGIPFLPAPANPFAQPLDGSIMLLWNAVPGAASYNIYWSNTAGVTPATGAKITALDIGYMHNSLNPSLHYYYVITAVDGSGVEGLPSTEVSALPGCSNGSQCTSGFCVDGFCCDRGCGGACKTCASAFGALSDGTCTFFARGADPRNQCGVFQCDGLGYCLGQCDFHSDCNSTHFCLTGQCVIKKAFGAACNSSAECVSDMCIAGVCQL